MVWHLISLFFSPFFLGGGGLIHWWFTAVLASVAPLASAVVGLLYFSNECFYEIEGDASHPETPDCLCRMEG